MHHPTDRIVHNMAFVTPVMEYWLERETIMLVPNIVKCSAKHTLIFF